jgi:hypothetical protein
MESSMVAGSKYVWWRPPPRLSPMLAPPFVVALARIFAILELRARRFHTVWAVVRLGPGEGLRLCLRASPPWTL